MADDGGAAPAAEEVVAVPAAEGAVAAQEEPPAVPAESHSEGEGGAGAEPAAAAPSAPKKAGAKDTPTAGGAPPASTAKKGGDKPAKKGGEGEVKKGAQPSARRASKERVEEDADLKVELPEVVEVKIANDGKMAKEMQQLIKELDKKQLWVQRATALRKLQGLVMGGAVGQFPAFLKAIKSSEFAAATKDLFAELRSQLVKEACDSVLRLAKGVIDAGAIKEYDQYFTDIVLVEAFRAVCKANVAIAASADAFLKGLVKDYQSLRILRGVVEPMVDAKANSRLRLQCSQLLTIILESWPSEKLTKGVVDLGNKRIDALAAVEIGMLKSLSDNKAETRVAAKRCYERYAELFPQRAPRLVEQMNRQQLRVVREGEPEAKGEDKEGVAAKGKARVSSISPERKPPSTLQPPVSEADRAKRKRDKELAERARARGAARGDGKEKELEPAEALVMCQGELAEAKDKVDELEKQLAEEKRKSKNLHKLKEEAIKNRDQEKQALEMALEAQKAAEVEGESEAGKEASKDKEELGEQIKDLQQRLKKEQVRARKMMEERDDWQRKCRVAENSLQALKLAKGAAREGAGDDKRDKRAKRGDNGGGEGGSEPPVAKGERRGAGDAGAGERKKSKLEEKADRDLAELTKQLEGKNKKLLEKVKKVTEDFGLLEEEKRVLEEKLAELEQKQERAGVEMDVKGGELRQVKERWQVREKDWFEARMNLEREVEALKAALQREKARAERAGEERQQLLRRVENFKARLGEEAEEESEEAHDEFSPLNLLKRKETREQEEAEGRSGRANSDESEAGSEVRQLKIELEETRQQVVWGLGARG